MNDEELLGKHRVNINVGKKYGTTKIYNSENKENKNS